MAAEDDDGDAFGDFTFASFPSNPPPTSTVDSHQLPQLNGLIPPADDDEWGDFVEFPPQFSSSAQLNTSESNDSAVGAADQTRDSKMASQIRWVKPSGALPLSLFGDVEEDGAGVDLNDSFGNGNTGNGSNSKSVGNNIGVNDIIANLYNQTPQIKFENGSGSKASTKVDPNAKGLVLDDKSPQVTVENEFYSDSKFNAVSTGLSEWNMDFNRFNLNSSFNGVKSLSDQTLQVHSENGSGMNSSPRVDSRGNDLILEDKTKERKVDTEVSSSNLNAVSKGFNEWNMDFNEMNLSNDASGIKNLSNQSQQKKSENSGLSVKSNGLDAYQDYSSSHLVGGWTSEMNHFSSSASTLSSNMNVLSSKLDMTGKENGSAAATPVDDEDDDGWEFKDAYSVPRAGDANAMVDSKVHDFSEKSAYSSGIGNGSIDFFGNANQSMGLFSTSPEVDLFSTSGGYPSSSQELNLLEIQPSIAAANSSISDTNLDMEQSDIKDGLNPSSAAGYAESDVRYGEFTTAFQEAEPRPMEALDGYNLSNEAVPVPDGKVQGKEIKFNNYQGALPLSIFGDEEPETNVHDFMSHATSYQRNNHASDSIVSINDLISNLYNQVEQASSVDSVQNSTKINLSPSDAAPNSDIVHNDDEDFDDNTWEFKDALSQKKDNNDASLSSAADEQLIKSSPSDAVSNSDIVHNDGGDFDDNTWEFTDASSGREDNNHVSLPSVADEQLISSSEPNLNDYVDFYSKLRDELCIIANMHLQSLKHTRNTSALSGEHAKVAAFDEDILQASWELDQMNVTFKEGNSWNHPSQEASLKEFVEVLVEPKFQIIESEYHLSEKLLLVERDLRLAIELIKHATTMLKILKIGTVEELQIYVTTWSKVISVCSQELRHGALIWKQATEKKIQIQLLSVPQGREFVLALGEIYRVVVLLGASAKTFKPWTISCRSNIDILLEECHSVWSTSGLEEALSSLSETTFSDNTSLIESIEYISDLDALALQNCISTQDEPLCRLSILTAGAVPGMKMIKWEDEQYFVTLANLWANFVSQNPPKLPHLHIVDEAKHCPSSQGFNIY